MSGTRARLGGLTCGLIAVIMVGTGCSAAAPNPRPSTSPTVSAPSSPLTPKPLQDVFDSMPGTKVTGAAAIKHYGLAAVSAAYREMVNVTFASRYNKRVMGLQPSATKPSDFRMLLPYMTQRARQEWRIVVAARLTDKKAAAAVAALRHYGWNAGGYVLRSALANTIHAPTVSAATATLDTTHVNSSKLNSSKLNSTKVTRLKLQFVSGVTVRLLDPQKKAVIDRTSDQTTLLLVPNAGPDKANIPWLIDGWHVKHVRGTISPDPAG